MQKQIGRKKFFRKEWRFYYTDCPNWKTETVYQLAKTKPKNIYKVDISETKTCGLGKVKIDQKVFNEYHQMMKTESDCRFYFSMKQMELSQKERIRNSNTAETENAIQNIILKKWKTSEGIFFATTNLVKNMDAAFERRFLFKSPI